MAKKKTAGGTPATELLTRHGIDFDLHPYAHDDDNRAFGDEAAAALGVDPRRIFKTLVVSTTSGKAGLACTVVPVAAHLDLKAIGALCQSKKVAMADPQIAARTSGYIVGGISPIGMKTALTTFIDVSGQGFDTVFVSAGKRGLQLELAPSALAQITSARFEPIAKWEVS